MENARASLDANPDREESRHEALSSDGVGLAKGPAGGSTDFV